jgi:membrane associated rhomboid family serine protease
MWVIKLLEYIFVLDFKTFGIYPRQFESLRGIITSPFIHGDFKHLINNSMPFFLLITAIRYFHKKKSMQIILFSWILTGFSLWLGGRYAWHIGASGLVYAFFSFLFFSGILSRDNRLIAISLLVIFLYGGMVWGIFPTNNNISWESHLFGLVVGFIVAFFFGKVEDKQVPIKNNTQNDEYTYFSNTHQNEIEVIYECKEDE